MSTTQFPQIFVKLHTSDKPLLEMQKRIEKLMLIQMWVGKASAMFERYFRILDQIDRETDPVKKGLHIEELEMCFMTSVSYYLRGFLNQKGSLNIEINNVTDDEDLRKTYWFLMDLRNDEYVHWKGARSSLTVKYSFLYLTANQCEFAKEVQANFKDKVGPSENTESFRSLFKVTKEYLEKRRHQEIEALRNRFAKPEVIMNSNLLNENDEPIFKKT